MNVVDSEKIAGTLFVDGMESTDHPDDADLIVVNTCAFVEEAREESIETILSLAEFRNEKQDCCNRLSGREIWGRNTGLFAGS